ncbi:uncharacterized protein AKAME5_000902900, partial [Lates japonicus]
MSISRALQLSVLLVGLCQARRARRQMAAPSPGGGPARVPAEDARWGWLTCCRGGGGSEQLEKQGEQVAAELDRQPGVWRVL